MVARILALLVAVGLVAGALAYRNRDGNDVVGSDDQLTVVCASEFVDVCSGGALASEARLSVEPAATTYDKLVAPGEATADFDVWIVPAPFADMVDAARQRDAKAKIIGERATVGGARAAVAIWKDRAEAAKRSCGIQELTWKCLGEVAGRGTWDRSGGPAQWGLVKVGLPDPAAESAGTVVLGAATAGYFGSASISSLDLDANDGYRGWLAGVAGNARSDATLVQMLSAGPAVLDMFLGLEPTMTPLVRDAVRGAQASVIYPAPVAGTEIQLVAIGSGRKLPDDLTDRVRDELRENGWQGRSAGLPSPGLLDALRTAWKEAAR